MAVTNADYWCESGVKAEKTGLQWTVNDLSYWDPKDVIRSSSFIDNCEHGISWYMQLAVHHFPDGEFPVVIISADMTSREFSFRCSVKLTNEKGQQFQSAKFSKIKYFRNEEGLDLVRKHHIIEKRGIDKWVSTDSTIRIDGIDLTNKLIIDCEVAIIGEWNSKSGRLDNHHHKRHNNNEESFEVFFPVHKTN